MLPSTAAPARRVSTVGQGAAEVRQCASRAVIMPRHPSSNNAGDMHRPFGLRYSGSGSGQGRRRGRSARPALAALGQEEQQQQQQQQAPLSVASLHGGGHRSSPVTEALNRGLGAIGLRLSDRAAAMLLLNLTVLCYASNWVIVKQAGEFDPFAFAFMRFLVAAAALSPYLKTAARDPRPVLRAGLEVGAWCSAGYLLQSVGLLATDASRASFLATFTVIVVPLLAGLSGRGVRPLTWASALGAFAGMALLEGSGAPPSLGDAWSFLSACAFGVQVFRTEHWSRTLGPRAALPLISVVLATTCAAAAAGTLATHASTVLDVVSHPQLVAQVGSLFAVPSAAGGTACTLVSHPQLAAQAAASGALPWQAALYTGLISTAACLVIEVFALRDVTSSEAAIIYSLEPVLGAASAYLLLGERWGPLGFAGAGLIVASSLATQLFGGEAGEPVVDE